MSDVSQSAPGTANPLLSAWQTPFETPPFEQILPEHFLPAFDKAFGDHTAEIEAIKNDPAEPTFDNTIAALERSGKLLSKVSAVFYDLVGAHSNPELLKIDSEVALKQARHWNPITMDAALFARVSQAARQGGDAEADPGAGTAAGADLDQFPPGWGGPRRGRQKADGGHQRAAGSARPRPSAITCSATSRTG